MYRKCDIYYHIGLDINNFDMTDQVTKNEKPLPALKY